MDFSVEHLSKMKLRQLQSERLQKLAAYLEKKSKFYQEKFRQSSISSHDIKSIDDLAKLPITYKQDLRDNYPFGMDTVPRCELQRIHCSSGSTGQPTVVTYTKDDMDVFSEVVARSLNAAGAKPGMLLHNAYGYGLFTGGLGLHYGAEKLGMCVLPISGGGTARQVDLITDFKPEVICCSPSYALTLGQEMTKRGIAPGQNSLKYAVLGSEAWTDIIRHRVETQLGVDATNIYGLSEIIGPGVANEDFEEKSGSYIWEDHFFPEILDPKTKEPVPNGQQGVLVLTTLTKKAMPLLRYWTNDICSIYYDSTGKRTMIKMTPIIGRADDMLIVRGVNVYPSQIEEAFSHVKGVVPNYYLTPIKDETMIRALDMDIEVSNQLVNAKLLEAGTEEYEQFTKNFEQIIRDEIKKRVGITTNVRVHAEDSLPKCTGGKINRILKKQ